MAVKTITLDLEAYQLLAREKRENESFSQVVKRHFRKGRTAALLLERLDDVCLSETTLKNLKRLVEARRESPARSPKP
jgi:predicted CopG family antitoxin